ncbi:MAG: hypothetical protein LUD72_00925 [Bacteroidales bacterium]|nr:hypothetical protein [Bacteroidales bacterium]
MTRLQEFRKKERSLITEIHRIDAMRERAEERLAKNPDLDTTLEEDNPWFLAQVIKSREDDLEFVREEIRELTEQGQ